MASLTKRLKHAVNAFNQNTPQRMASSVASYGSAYSTRPDRVRLNVSNERSIITSIYTRIAIDLAALHFRHVKLDDENRYLEEMKSGLNDCFTVEANTDQAPRDFVQDLGMTLCAEGYLAIVPVDTTLDPVVTGAYDILTMRIGSITQWYPKHIRVSVYNEETGRREELTLPKKNVAIVPNPLYSIMNEPNSTLQRLIRKLNLLDAVDEQSASGKLDLIIQLPYVIKSEARRQQAEQRREDIEFQLKGSKYGIAYTDGTEKITQLNRPAENNLMAQIEYLTNQLYAQLGITAEVMNGTADEKTMLNYMNRTIEPMADGIVQAMQRSFLTKTARTQKQAIRYFRDPFKLVPISQLAEIADKFTRNEIASSNEFRQVVGWKPSKDPKADQLINSNMPAGTGVVDGTTPSDSEDESSVDNVLGSLESQLDDIFATLGVDANAPDS